MSQFLPRAEVYVVTTPQPAAQRVAQRAAYMAEKVNLEVKGIIENMSWFTGDDGRRYALFGAGGGQALADELDVPLLAQIPLLPALRAGSDDGKPKIFRDSAVTNLTEFFARFRDLNIGSSTELDRLVATSAAVCVLYHFLHVAQPIGPGHEIFSSDRRRLRPPPAPKRFEPAQPAGG